MIGTVALLGLTLGVLSRADAFHVRRIQVVGASRLSEAEVISRSGLSDRTNVVWMDAGAAVRRLESDPWVAQARIDRQLPFGLRITLIERTPVAIVDESGRRLLIAADGTALGLAGPGGRASLPEVILPPRPALAGPAPGADGAARVVSSLPGRIRREVRRVVVGADGTIRLLLREGPTVDYGWAEDMARKADVLGRLVSWSRGEGQQLRAVSLVAPGAPAAEVAR